jgi:hypothetical protein
VTSRKRQGVFFRHTVLLRPMACIARQPAPILFQYPPADAVLAGCKLCLRLPACAAQQSQDSQRVVHFALRRFDMQELQVFDAASGKMAGIRLSQAMFTLQWIKPRVNDGSLLLEVSVNTKHLPVATRFGGAPFVFCMWVVATNELLISTPFQVMSKEIELPLLPRAPVKRARGPALAAPTIGPAGPGELEINVLWQQHMWTQAAEADASIEHDSTLFETI